MRRLRARRRATWALAFVNHPDAISVVECGSTQTNLSDLEYILTVSLNVPQDLQMKITPQTVLDTLEKRVTPMHFAGFRPHVGLPAAS